MDLYSSGTLTGIASSATGVILNSVNIAAGVFVLELDLSSLVAADSIGPRIAYKVVTADADAPEVYSDHLLAGVQAIPRWQSEPFVVDENCALYVGVYNGGAGSVTIPYKLFRLATPIRTDFESGTTYTTGNSIVLTSAVAGAHVLLFNGYNLSDGYNIKITTKVDGEVVDEVHLVNYIVPDLFHSEPILASATGCEVTISFVAAAGSNTFSANLMRVS